MSFICHRVHGGQGTDQWGRRRFLSLYGPRDWIHFSRLRVPLPAEHLTSPRTEAFSYGGQESKLRSSSLSSKHFADWAFSSALLVHFKDISLLLCTVYVCESGYTCAIVCMWRQEDKLWESVLFFCHVCSGTRTPDIKLDSKCHYPLNLLAHTCGLILRWIICIRIIFL